jgi:hypothetical protein
MQAELLNSRASCDKLPRHILNGPAWSLGLYRIVKHGRAPLRASGRPLLAPSSTPPQHRQPRRPRPGFITKRSTMTSCQDTREQASPMRSRLLESASSRYVSLLLHFFTSPEPPMVAGVNVLPYNPRPAGWALLSMRYVVSYEVCKRSASSPLEHPCLGHLAADNALLV